MSFDVWRIEASFLPWRTQGHHLCGCCDWKGQRAEEVAVRGTRTRLVRGQCQIIRQFYNSAGLCQRFFKGKITRQRKERATNEWNWKQVKTSLKTWETGSFCFKRQSLGGSCVVRRILPLIVSFSRLLHLLARLSWSGTFPNSLVSSQKLPQKFCQREILFWVERFH